MADIWMNVDAALSEVPVNLLPLIDDADFKTIEADVNYNAAGLSLIWHFVTTAGAYSQTAVTPTNTGGAYDWVEQGNGMFTIEIPASGGATINNDTEGFGWFTGVATGILPWRGPVIGFRAAALNDALIDGGDTLDVNTVSSAQIADSVPADGSLPTNEQALYMILQRLTEVAVSGTTMTVKKVDGSTSLFTITLNDATNPTTMTRAS